MKFQCTLHTGFNLTDWHIDADSDSGTVLWHSDPVIRQPALGNIPSNVPSNSPVWTGILFSGTPIDRGESTTEVNRFATTWESCLGACYMRATDCAAWTWHLGNSTCRLWRAINPLQQAQPSESLSGLRLPAITNMHTEEFQVAPRRWAKGVLLEPQPRLNAKAPDICAETCFYIGAACVAWNWRASPEGFVTCRWRSTLCMVVVSLDDSICYNIPIHVSLIRLTLQMCVLFGTHRRCGNSRRE